MIQREIKNIALKLFNVFPILAITGPRQSGKTTLVKQLFPEMNYVSLEDIDFRNQAITDPRGFLSNYEDGAIIDEIQRVPELFSYLQTLTDSKGTSSQFVITGSQNFLLMENLSQSLAGRVALLKLLPLSQSELKSEGLINPIDNKVLINGGYPALWQRNIDPILFYPNYISTYIERDVRNIKNIGNLEVFGRFIKLCAGRSGQPLSYSSLASDAGITPNTAKAWISILVNSYIIYLLPPFYKNFNKRLSKMPKLYFYDTGLLCSLLGIENSKQINTHFLTGGIFENYVISEVLKHFFNKSKNANIYFFKDNKGKEVDLIIDKNEKHFLIEIKASKTYNDFDFNNLNYLKKLSATETESFIISKVEKDRKTKFGHFISWNNLNQFFKDYNI